MFSSKSLKRVITYVVVATLASSTSFALSPVTVAQANNTNRTRLRQRQLNRQCSAQPFDGILSDATINAILQRLNNASTASDANSQSLGDGYLSIGRYGEAAVMYQRGVAYAISQKNFTLIGIGEIGSQSGVGTAYLSLGGYQKAEAAYLKMFDAHSKIILNGKPAVPGSYRYNQLGNALLLQGKLDEASAAYRKGLASRPIGFTQEESFLRVNQANLEFFTRGPAAAIATYNKELLAQGLFSSNNVVILNNRGLAYQALGQLEQATASYTSAMAVFSRAGVNGVFNCQWQTFSNYARLLAQQGKIDEAIVHYRRAIELTNRIWKTSLPTLLLDDQRAYRQMVGPIYQEFTVLLLQQGRLDEAIKSLSILYAPSN